MAQRTELAITKILRAQAVRYVTASGPLAGLPVMLHGKGQSASLAVTYALQMPAWKPLRKRGFILEDGFLSFRHFIDRPLNETKSFRLQHCDAKAEEPLDREIPPAFFVFNALRAFDLPDLLKAGGIPGLAVNPINGDWQRVTAQDAARYLPGKMRPVCSERPFEDIRAYFKTFKG